jgi:hypothetical protein
LAKELQKLAEQDRQTSDEMERLGLDKGLAQANPQQLQEALQKQGLSQEMIDQIKKKVAASQGACGRCEGLGQALAGIGAAGDSLSADDLSDAIEQLDGLESLQEQAAALRASLDEISRRVDSLGQGMCEGLGGEGSQRQDRSGSGDAQGEGIGLAPGSHAITSDALTATKTTRAAGKSGGDQVVASWYFRDTLVKGEAQRAFSEVVQAGRASAAEALSDNQMPRRYEEAVKAYFNQLEKNGPKP